MDSTAERRWAHSENSEGLWHVLSDHLIETGRRASEFAEPFESARAARLIGELHDIGKADPAWQEYLLSVNAGIAHAKIDHKHAGALLVSDWGLGTCAYPIAGHHGGMPNSTDLGSRIAAGRSPGQRAAIEYSIYELGFSPPDREAVIPPQFLPTSNADRSGYRRLEFWLRMLFSTLVDADWLDTEAHFRPGRRDVTEVRISIEALESRFRRGREASIALRSNDPVADARATLFEEVISAAGEAPGWFELTAPTGSGKTIACLAFALRHAQANHLRRVVTAVPFISVTEQVAGVYRGILEDGGSPVVLEHHSGIAAESIHPGNRSGAWSRLATENWDAQVIVTTMVQLLESLFENRPSRTRKLHRLAGSVLILDEVQSLPWRLLEPTLDVLRELVRSYGCSVVFSTATQPPFDQVGSVEGFRRRQLCSPQWFSVFERTRVEFVGEPMSWSDFAARVANESALHNGQCLVVLNTIRDARELSQHLAGHLGLSHLSSRLCPAHRLRVLDDMYGRLAAGEPCTLVSTQLVEAGIDIDFPVAIRACGPIPAIAQVAGRVNRHGLREEGTLIVLDPEDGHVPPYEYAIGTSISRQLLQSGANPLDPETVTIYYDRLIFATSDKLDLHGVQDQRERMNFANVAAKYRVIADETTPVLVPYGEFDPRQLRIPEDPRARRALLRQLQRYSVSLRNSELEKYTNLIETRDGGVLIWHGPYDSVYGLVGDEEIEEENW